MGKYKFHFRVKVQIPGRRASFFSRHGMHVGPMYGSSSVYRSFQGPQSGLASHFTPSGACSVVSLRSIPVRVCTMVPLHAAVLPEPGDCCPFTRHSCQGLESLLHHRHGIPARIHVGSHLSTEFWSLVRGVAVIPGLE